MDRKYFAVSFLVVLLASASCSQVLPLSSIVNESYIAKPGDYVVLDEVEGRATSASLFGIIPLRTDSGYLSAYQDAMANSEHSGANGLIEVFSDVKITYAPFRFLPIYTSWTTIVYGRAIRGGELATEPSTGGTE